MTITGKFTKFAVAAGVAGALVLPAAQAQAADRTERAVIGALLGGVAGAAISHGDGGAAALGAVAGAAIGASTGHERRYRSAYRTSRPYAYDNRYAYRGYGDSRYAYQGYRDGYRTSSYGGYYDGYGAYHR